MSKTNWQNYTPRAKKIGKVKNFLRVFLKKRFFTKITLIIVTFCLFITIIFCSFYFNIDQALSKKNQLDLITNWTAPDNSIVYDSDQNSIGEFFSRYHIYTPFDKIPKDMINAIIAIEDNNFWNHLGLDFKAIARAIIVYLSNYSKGYTQGASTITQQVVRNFLLTKEKTISRKLTEIFLAVKLERLISKEKIIEIYANAFFLGNRSYGVAAAAKRYFNKDLSFLELHETALIAGLFQSPSRFNPHKHPRKAKSRQKKVLQSMFRLGYIDKNKFKTLLNKKLIYSTYTPLNEKHAPYFVDFIKEKAEAILGKASIKNQGLRIYTSLDSILQKTAKKSIDDHHDLLNNTARDFFKNKKVIKSKLEAAILVTNPKNGKILAMVGGRDYKFSQFNRTTQAQRQAGSLFKPIVYSLALIHGFRWNDVIEVAPITLSGNYRPRNPTRDYMTQTTLLRAFYRSMNSPTIELGQKIGLNSIIKHAKLLGIESPIRQEFGSILGSSELNMFDLSRLYNVFENQGILTQLTSINEIRDRNGQILYKQSALKNRQKRVLDENIAFLMKEAMRQVLTRGSAYKFSSLAKIAIGKTGTTNGSRDNWFAGSTPNFTTVTWVGSENSKAQKGNIQGSTIALPIWAQFVKEAHSIYPSHKSKKPNNVFYTYINSKTGIKSRHGIKMWFLKNRPPREGRSSNSIMSHSQSFRNPLIK